jgi:hypothetical protein
LVKAYYWISLSANRRNASAIDARDYVADKMSREQIAEAKRLILEYEEQAHKTCAFCHPSKPTY